MSAIAALTDSFAELAATGARGSALYTTIGRAVAADPPTAGILLAAPVSQRRAVLLLAAVHDLLLGDLLLGDLDDDLDDDLARRLAAHYPTLGGAPGPDAGAAFVAFAGRHRRALEALVASRSTQTNEVARSAALRAGVVAAASALGAGAGLAVIDVGCSAGLNLLFDQYAIDYSPHGSVMGRPPEIVCVSRGAPVPIDPAPIVRARIGIDRSPIDLGDERERRWLLACVWPDQLDRFAGLQQAIETATAPGHVVCDLIAADAAAGLRLALAGVPTDVPVVVMNSWALCYLSTSEQAVFATTLTSLAATHSIAWLSAERPEEIPGIPTPPGRPGATAGATAVVLTTFGPDGPEPRRVADMHPHGRWIDWYERDAE